MGLDPAAARKRAVADAGGGEKERIFRCGDQSLFRPDQFQCGLFRSFGGEQLIRQPEAAVRFENQQPPFAALFLHEQASLRVQRRDQHILVLRNAVILQNPPQPPRLKPRNAHAPFLHLPVENQRQRNPVINRRQMHLSARRGSFIGRWEYAQRAVRLQDDAPGLAQADNAAASHPLHQIGEVKA